MLGDPSLGIAEHNVNRIQVLALRQEPQKNRMGDRAVDNCPPLARVCVGFLCNEKALNGLEFPVTEESFPCYRDPHSLLFFQGFYLHIKENGRFSGDFWPSRALKSS